MESYIPLQFYFAQNTCLNIPFICFDGIGDYDYDLSDGEETYFKDVLGWFSDVQNFDDEPISFGKAKEAVFTMRIRYWTREYGITVTPPRKPVSLHIKFENPYKNIQDFLSRSKGLNYDELTDEEKDWS
jgi:hypothetical protein